MKVGRNLATCWLGLEFKRIKIKETTKIMKAIIKVTEIFVENKSIANRTVLIGVENIIKIARKNVDWFGIGKFDFTKIESRGAMVVTTYVNESVEEIYKLINS